MSAASTPKVHRRTRTGCLTCRTRHVKCDESKPVCRRCQVVSRPCIYSDAKIHQKGSICHGGTSFNNRADEGDYRDEEIDIEARSSSSSHQTPVTDDTLDNSPFVDRCLHVTRPTSDTQTFRLLQYYVQKVGPWLDLSDGERHFTTMVPHEIFQCPILFHAVCAFSATQLSRHDGRYRKLADMHYSRCVADLIPILESEDLAADGRVLAATVILRMYEVLHCAPEHDLQQHLLGSCSLTQVSGSSSFDSLRIAAFWVYLRQDVQMAERYRRQTLIDLDNCQFHRSYDISPASDTTWANRMVWIYANIVNLCFGVESERTELKWNMLDEQLDMWKENLPSTFAPLYYKPATAQSKLTFPTEWFASDWHVLGFQTYHMAKLLLNLYTPRQKSGGLRGLQEQRSRDAILQHHARAICGISVTNICEAARIHACEHLRICREVLILPEELNCISTVLQQVQSDTEWPTLPAWKLKSDAANWDRMKRAYPT